MPAKDNITLIQLLSPIANGASPTEKAISFDAYLLKPII